MFGTPATVLCMILSSLLLLSTCDAVVLQGKVDTTPQPLKLHQLPVVDKACAKCCHHGEKVVPCLDVETCAQNGPANGKYAIAMSFVGKVGNMSGMSLPNIKSMEAAAKMANADLLMAMQKSDREKMTAYQKELLKKYSVKLVDVDWAIPPKMKAYQEAEAPLARQDFVRLHLLGMERYDAIAYYDNDVEIQGDITPVLRCAASGKFLSTNGPLAPLNLGFFALKPDNRLFQASLNFALHANYSDNTGWGEMGWAPAEFPFVDADGGQGFWYALFYKSGGAAQRALQSAGLSSVDASQIDRCIWNYQKSPGCKEDLDCRRVRVHHKPTWRTESTDCQKLQHH